MSLLAKLTVGALAAAGIVALGSRGKKSARVTAGDPKKPAMPKTRQRRKRRGTQKRTKTA